jgi:8-oxo-dGTP pyrophosphatase MutT (NUDIX family)
MSKPIVKAEDLPYRPCVGVMVLNRQGLVWAGRRIPEENSEYDGSPQLWQMPQGGIDKGEDPLEAAYRELYEETGMRSVTLLAEAADWINYDLPPQSDRHRTQGKIPRPDAALVRIPLRRRRERDRHQPAARWTYAGIRCLGMEADGQPSCPDRAVQAGRLR